jgi:hypothetical protein
MRKDSVIKHKQQQQQHKKHKKQRHQPQVPQTILLRVRVLVMEVAIRWSRWQFSQWCQQQQRFQ